MSGAAIMKALFVVARASYKGFDTTAVLCIVAPCLGSGKVMVGDGDVAKGQQALEEVGHPPADSVHGSNKAWRLGQFCKVLRHWHSTDGALVRVCGGSSSRSRGIGCGI